VISDEKLYTLFGINYGVKTWKVSDLKKAKKNYKETVQEALSVYPKQNPESKILVCINDNFKKI
jgi:hypothetical protein